MNKGKGKASKPVHQSTSVAIQPLLPYTDTQFTQLDTQAEFPVTMVLGFPGVGKTHIALHWALSQVLVSKSHRHVKVIRPPVQVNNIGHLPGDVQDKTKEYRALYTDIVNAACGRGDAMEVLYKRDVITCVPTTFEQGKTYHDTIVIVDEVGNMTHNELDMAITRCGVNSRIIFCGDRQQCYLRKGDELDKFLNTLSNMPSATVMFYDNPDDIVREDFVSDYIKAREGISGASTDTSKDSK